MASSENVICNICEVQSISTPAVKWCPKCDEAFCSGCIKHHAVARATRGHDVVDVGDLSKLPESVLQIKQDCEEHDLAYQNFCIDHDCPCCPKCINTTHKHCKELPVLDDVIGNAQSSTALPNLEEQIRLKDKFLLDLALDKDNNVECIKEDAATILNKIRSRKSEIISKLDALEKEAIQQLNNAKNEAMNNLEALKKQIKEKKRINTNLIENVDVLKKHGSNLQIFLGIREFEKSCSKNELVAEDDKQKQYLRSTVKLFFKAETQVFDKGSFGNVSLQFSESSLKDIKDDGPKRAQIADVTAPFERLQMKASTILSKYDRLSGWCLGCTILPNKVILIAGCLGKNLIFINQDGHIDGKMKLQKKPYDVANIEDRNLVAVTLRDEKEILLVDYDHKTIIKTINVGAPCSGLAVADGKVVVSTRDGIILFDSEFSKSAQNLNIGLQCLDEYVDFNGKYIYYSHDDTVKCSDIKGNIKWTFQNPKVLQGARGIKVNRRGIVFVSCVNNYTIVAISPCGTKHKWFPVDFVNHPRTLCFDGDDENKLLVCGNEGDLVYYTVSM